MKTFADQRKAKPVFRRYTPMVRVDQGGQARTAQRAQVREILHAPRFQPKLTVGPPNDAFEREADRVADAVMRMPDDRLSEQRAQPMCSDCEGELQRQSLKEDEVEIQAKEVAGTTPVVTPEAEAGISSLRGGGQPLSESTRQFFEPRFGNDFSGVRVHTDDRAVETARAINARAYTIGNDVVFAAGEFSPAGDRGRRLLAHELAHVVQQGNAEVRRKGMHTEREPSPSARPGAPSGVIQRALACDLDHITTECAGAAASCNSIQDSYCKKKHPSKKEIDELHANAVKGAKTYESTHPHAAKNLLHFLDGTGTKLEMPVAIFRDHKETKEQLEDTHRDRFLAGAKRRLGTGDLAPGKPAEMVWTDTANAFSILSRDDLGLSVGGYTLCSKVTVSATKKVAKRYAIAFDTWTVQAFDCYNWDPGKGVGIPGADDNDLCCLENAGRAKHFRIRTKPWKNTHAPSTAAAEVTV